LWYVCNYRFICLAACCIPILFCSNTGAAEGEDHCGEAPVPPALPEDVDQTLDTLSATRESFVDYQNNNGVYLDCLIALMDALQTDIEGAGASDASNLQRKNNERRFAITARSYNEAVSEEEEAAVVINQAIEDYQKDGGAP
jgi:hypothetical protein